MAAIQLLGFVCLLPSPSSPFLPPSPFPPSSPQRQHRVQLVPLSPYGSSDEHTLSDSEHPEHLYSLGRFVSVNPLTRDGLPQGNIPLPVRRATHSVGPTRQQLRLLEASSALDSSDAEEREGGGERGEKTMPVRSYTYNARVKNSVEDKEQVNSCSQSS